MDKEDTVIPVITLSRKRFTKFLGRKITLAEMIKWLPWLGFDIEEVERNNVKVEFNPNRIDFCSCVGVVRAFEGMRGWKTGLPEYDVKYDGAVLYIDMAVSKVRPFMLAAIVRDIELDEEDVVDLMEMQEDLHWGLGRDRKKASIGVHNLDVIKSPFTFTAVEPNSVKFVPLDMTENISPKKILEKHEKGILYRQLVDWAPKYPLLIDIDSKVLSMPPIINGELTRIDEKTKNLFLDITGTDYVAVEKSLNVLSTALADMGGIIEMVKVKYTDRTVFSPDLRPKKMKLRTAYANTLLGLRLSELKTIECLKKSRLGAKKVGNGVIEVEIPAYRIDILHEVDLVEEVAIGNGYYKLKPTFPSSVTIGEQHPINRTADLTRQIMIGMGFTEVMNFTLTNETLHYKKMRRKPEKAIKLANPVSNEYTIMRQNLLPGLIKNLSDNKQESFPQKIFEVSDTMRLNRKLETQCDRVVHIAAASSHATASFTEIKSAMEALMTNIGLNRWRINAAENSSFISGRVAIISVKDKQIGIVGEIHPEVLNNFQLENPIAAFEIDLETAYAALEKS